MEESFKMFKSHLMSSPPKLPVVFHNLISTWPALRWTPISLVDVFGEINIQFRIGRITSDVVQYENDCNYVSATMLQFNEWCSGQTCSLSNPFSEYSRQLHWCYADYKHLSDMFPPGDKRDSIMSSVKWSELGFKERNGEQSTFWLGTKGAYTVCHYDTYGCNLVVQIYGRKRWILLPPSQTTCLYPTRVPYEESSVFSEVNVRSPDWSRHAQFRRCTPYEVVLEPGDILYVPHLWWHFVENLETSVSVNTWIDLGRTDDHERIKEAVTRTLAHLIMTQEESCDPDSWLNPTEDLTSHSENLGYIRSSVLAVKRNRTDEEETLNNSLIAADVKRPSGPDEHYLGASPENCVSPAKKLRRQENSKTTTESNFATGGEQSPCFLSAEFESRFLKRIYPRSIEQVLRDIHSHLKIEKNVEDNENVVDKSLTSSPSPVTTRLHGDKSLTSSPSPVTTRLHGDENCKDDTPPSGAGVNKSRGVDGPGTGDRKEVSPGFTSIDLAAVLLHPDVISVIYSKLVDRYHLPSAHN